MSIRPSVLIAALLLPAIGLAQDAGQEEYDPPERVARLSLIRGDVSFLAAGEQAPVRAELNRPVTSGDRLLTGEDSRSELTLGLAAMRLDQRTEVVVANLDNDFAQIEVLSGAVTIHVRELQQGHAVEVDVPSAAIQLLEPGDYRVDVDPDGGARVSVHQGRAEIDSGRGPTEIGSGQQARLDGAGYIAEVGEAGPADAFDDWSRERERELSGADTVRYVSREVVGYEDLDPYGEWATEREYGPVWYPRVAVGWSPYSAGYWSWISPWGWTWIDSAPWGFAPFHYGRWAHVRSRWCWVPGPRHYRPVYAPALVGWTGSPYADVSIVVGGRVGWYALGPREVYIPYRHASARYLRRVNISNTIITNNTYITNIRRNRVAHIRHANRDVPGALNTRPRQEFEARRRRENGDQQHAWRAERPPRLARPAEPARSQRMESRATERRALSGNASRDRIERHGRSESGISARSRARDSAREQGRGQSMGQAARGRVIEHSRGQAREQIAGQFGVQVRGQNTERSRGQARGGQITEHSRGQTRGLYTERSRGQDRAQVRERSSGQVRGQIREQVRGQSRVQSSAQPRGRSIEQARGQTRVQGRADRASAQPRSGSSAGGAVQAGRGQRSDGGPGRQRGRNDR